MTPLRCLSRSLKPGFRAKLGAVIATSMLWLALAATAQQYSIDWYTIDGGGGVSSGGTYTLSGTIGQPDAGVLTGGPYTLSGGFWTVMAVQNPAAPLLSVALSTTNTVILSWPLSATQWTLNQTASLSGSPVTWSPISLPYSTNASTVFYVQPAPVGNRFYRLSN